MNRTSSPVDQKVRPGFRLLPNNSARVIVVVAVAHAKILTGCLGGGPAGSYDRSASGSPAEAEVTITAPAVITGIAPATATAPLGSTIQFYAYSVGAANREVTFQVNGVTGGTEQTGTITNLGRYLPDGRYRYWGLYTAPSSMPTSGDTVMITAVSQADPSKSSSAVVTLTSQ